MLIDNSTFYAQEQPLDEQQWEEIIKDYDYGDIEKNPPKEIEKSDENKTDNRPTWSLNPEVVKVVAISVIIILLTLLILQLMGVKLIRKKVDRKHTVNYDYQGQEPEQEGLYETQFEREIRLALEQKNYRKAIRIYFVTIVDELSLTHLITKEKDKTNQRYINELRGKKEQAPFRKLARLFEIVWYGEVNLSEEEYNQLAPEFSDFLQKIISR